MFGDLAVEQQSDGLGAGVNGEVGPVCDRVQECVGHRPAPSTALVDVEVGTAGVVTPVELLDRGDAHLGGGGLPGVQDLPAHPGPLDADLPTDAVPVVGAGEVVLQLLVDGQGLSRIPRAVRSTPEPSLVAGGAGPHLVVAGLTAHVNHGVDR